MEAARRLEDVKVRLLNYPMLQALAGATQGACYSQLGQYDLALQAYDWALEKNPNLEQAQRGREQMLAMNNPDSQGADPLQLEKTVDEILELPEEQQNWDELTTKIDEFVDGQAQRNAASEAWLSSRKQLLRAQMYATRAMAAEDKAAKTAPVRPGPQGHHRSLPAQPRRPHRAKRRAATSGPRSRQGTDQGSGIARHDCEEKRRHARLPHPPHRFALDDPRRGLHQSHVRRRRRPERLVARRAGAGLGGRRHSIRAVRPVPRRPNVHQPGRRAVAQQPAATHGAVRPGAQARR